MQTKRALLADDIGFGKTAQASVAASLTNAPQVLVITKKSLLWQWCREITYWTSHSVQEYTTRSKSIPETKFVVTNYDTVVRRIDELLAKKFKVVILDEATAIKNRKAIRSKTVKKLAKPAEYVFALTGTPISNQPAELWHILHTLNPKGFASYWRFINDYCDVVVEKYGKRSFSKIVGIKDTNSLAKVLEPIMLRRTIDSLDLPEPVEEAVYLQLTPLQHKLYKQMEETFMTWVNSPEAEELSGVVFARNALAKTIRLRQIACSPALIGDKDESCKTEAVMDLVDAIAPFEKIIIFTNFKNYANILAKKLADFKPVVITGAVNDAGRAKAQQTFLEDDECRVMICTIMAASEGLNLQVASTIIFTDLDYVPANIRQAVGRAYRRGQTKVVKIIKLVCSGTVEESVLNILEHKETVLSDMEYVNLLIKDMRNK